jgi:predicted O-methyltransferase YrrM
VSDRGAPTAPTTQEAPVDDVLAELRRLVADEQGALATARERAAQSGDVPSPEVGALLAWAATTVGARHVVEVGSAGGVSALWLLRGMEERGVLTSVEHDAHRHGLATSAYESAGVAERVRSILGEPGQVLPRLSDDGYDLVLVQGRASEYPVYVEHAVRLLRPGGVLIARDVLRPGDGADALATFAVELAEHDRLAGTILPVDGGVALATLTTG